MPSFSHAANVLQQNHIRVVNFSLESAVPETIFAKVSFDEYFKISSYARQGYTVFFTLFLFLAPFLRINPDKQPSSFIYFAVLLSLLNHDNRQALAESIRQRWLVYILLVVFCVYYALSNIWGRRRNISTRR